MLSASASSAAAPRAKSEHIAANIPECVRMRPASPFNPDARPFRLPIDKYVARLTPTLLRIVKKNGVGETCPVCGKPVDISSNSQDCPQYIRAPDSCQPMCETPVRTVHYKCMGRALAYHSTTWPTMTVRVSYPPSEQAPAADYMCAAHYCADCHQIRPVSLLTVEFADMSHGKSTLRVKMWRCQDGCARLRGRIAEYNVIWQ
jgi:hypothetical protein